MIKNWENNRRYAIEGHPKCHQVLCICEYDTFKLRGTTRVQHSYVYRWHKRFAEGEIGVEDKKTQKDTTYPYSLDLVPLDIVFFPQLKSDLHGKQFSDLDELRTE